MPSEIPRAQETGAANWLGGRKNAAKAVPNITFRMVSSLLAPNSAWILPIRGSVGIRV
jgi:hypothetical protein